MTVEREARCCCGAVRLSVSGEPVMNAVCSCENCKRRTGSAFGWQVYFPESAVAQPSGDFRLYAFDAQSGRVERAFCAGCGTTVFWRAAVFPGVVGVAGGCFADGRLGAPTTAASDNARCAWIVFPDGMTTL